MAGRLHKPFLRPLLGGKSGAKVGMGTLAFTGGGAIDPVPNWMRGGTQGVVTGWFTYTASAPSLARLFYFNNSANSYVVDCYAEPGSNRWQWLCTTNSVARGTCFINGGFPASGTTVGFALGWRADRMFGVIGSQNGVGMNIDAAVPIGGLTRAYFGDRFDGIRKLPANFHALEYLDFFPGDAAITTLAQRPLPNF